MTDLDSMLTDAGRARDNHSPTPDGVVDADLQRAHRALTRRRAKRGAGRTAVLAAFAVAAVAVINPRHAGQQVPPSANSVTPGAGTQTSVPSQTPPSSPHQTATASITDTVEHSIRLIAYTGTQPAGYTVDSVPDGWVIQGVNNYALVIAEKSNPDKSIDSFEGKLVVMLQSVDQTDLPPGKAIMVGSAKGLVSRADAFAAQLFFTDANGHHLDIQVPPSLHWSDAQIADFGTSVHVNPNAQAGRG